MESLRRRIFQIVSVAGDGDWASRIFDGVILFLILLNIFAVLLESVANIGNRYSHQFDVLAQISIVVFSVEYLSRLWSCLEHPSGRYKGAFLGRQRYLLTPLMLTDLLAIVPFYLNIGLTFDFRLFRLFRLLSILNVTRNSRALQLLFVVVRRESSTLLAIFLIIAVLLILISSTIYAIESKVQPDTFGSIPSAMWWSMATLTTVGYGDAVPHTILGKVFGTVVMIIGIAMYAVPTGILVSSFYQEVKRKDFIATWDLVAQIPFFSHFSATEIARITDLLRLHTVQAGEVIFKAGEKPTSMYFIVSGEVEIVVNANRTTKSCRGGDFFGEVGVLYKTDRTASVTAKTFSELLQLDARDMELFLESHPELRERILAKAEVRKNN